MTVRTATISRQQLVDAAKTPLLLYGRKDWEGIKDSITNDFVYDEVATNRKASGQDKVLPLWRGWATALPDSAPTIHDTFVNGNTVILECTWTGTHKGPLETPNGPIQPTGKRIELRACNVFEIDPETMKAKSQRQYFDMATLFSQLGVTTKA